METGTIQNLLSQVSAIVQQYEKVAELTGENFNVFKILGVETKEVKTHSAFIAELLKPNGSHGQKEIFLKLFTEQLGINDFECKNAKIEVEKHVGKISEDYKDGGYIDIVISNNTNAIIIENKIYAGDQLKQLERYAHYGESAFKGNYELLYLTLDKHEPDEKSLDEVSKNKAKLISYKDEILIWLEKCREKSATQPILRESITQYIYLIKYLTGQTMKNGERNKIVELIRDNYIAASEISANYENARVEILQDFWDVVYKRLLEHDTIKNIWEIKTTKNKSQNKITHLHFSKAGWENTSIFFSGFEIQFHYGIHVINKEGFGQIYSSLGDTYPVLNKWERSDYAVIYQSVDNYDFNKKENVFDITKNKEEKVKSTSALIVELSKELEELCNDIEKLFNKE